MSTVKVGALMAVVIAGPPLYALVGSGDLDATDAFERGGLVLVVCALGASWVMNLAKGYETQAKPGGSTREAKRARELAAEAHDLVEKERRIAKDPRGPDPQRTR